MGQPPEACKQEARDIGSSSDARTAIQALRPGQRIEVVGIGFFDFIHNQRCRAANGIELHPVLSVRASRSADVRSILSA